jgi:hypothetical protein
VSCSTHFPFSQKLITCRNVSQRRTVILTTPKRKLRCRKSFATWGHGDGQKKQWKKAIEAKQESKSHFVGPLVSFSLTQTIFMADREMKRRGLFFFYLFTQGFLYLHQALSYKTFYYSVVS